MFPMTVKCLLWKQELQHDYKFSLRVESYDMKIMNDK